MNIIYRINSPDTYPVQNYICDLLSFVLQCTSFSPLCITSRQWSETLLKLAECSKTMLLTEHFRCKLLILRLLRQILPHVKLSNNGRKTVCIQIYNINNKIILNYLQIPNNIVVVISN